jgi:pre-mRNA-splicing factor SPF27
MNNSTLIDALPYIDKEYSNPEIKKQVDDLISKEMLKMKKEKNFSLENYLEKYPELEFKFTPLMKNEMDRIEVNFYFLNFQEKRTNAKNNF